MSIIHADLHIHTCLSPCAELEMSPKGIVSEAVNKGIDMIAVCDHNSAENVAAVIEASQQTKLTVLPGMEITSKEEVHIVGIFRIPEDTDHMQALVYGHLEGHNDTETFGLQVVVEADGTVTGYNERLLIGATDLSLEHVVQAIHDHNGLAIAAHIDREGFGILGQLGFIPPDLDLDALEVSSRTSLKDATATFTEYADYPFVQSSDAHLLDAIGSGITPLMLEAATFDELRMALKGDQGRGVHYEG
ncbi:MAG: PHP domain-containing protein [Fidelibacterota bacterium]|nr:MAG: PHP domain-containing protein [Candidatus Neomarinimicrobiota bacterium]